MVRSNRSKILSTTFICGLAFLAAGCSQVDFSRWDYEPQVTDAGNEAQIDPIMRVAHATRAQGDVATAAGLYQRAHQLAPDLPEPLLYLGFSLNQMGATEQASAAFRQALIVDPDHPEAQRGLALALLQQEQPELALAHLEAALEVKEDARVYNAMGVAYDMMGDHHGAHTLYYLGLDVQPDNLSIRSNLGLSLAMAGYHRDGIAMLKDVARDPRATEANRQSLALAYGMAGETQDLAQREAAAEPSGGPMAAPIEVSQLPAVTVPAYEAPASAAPAPAAPMTASVEAPAAAPAPAPKVAAATAPRAARAEPAKRTTLYPAAQSYAEVLGMAKRYAPQSGS